MTEQNKMAEMMECSRCNCKYHCVNDFGYTKNNVLYKTCVKCRDKRKKEAVEKKITPTIYIKKEKIKLYYREGKKTIETTFRYTKCGKDEAVKKAKEYIEELRTNNPDKFTDESYVKEAGDKPHNDASLSVNKGGVHVSVMVEGKRVYKQIRHTNRSVEDAIELAEEFINQFD